MYYINEAETGAFTVELNFPAEGEVNVTLTRSGDSAQG